MDRTEKVEPSPGMREMKQVDLNAIANISTIDITVAEKTTIGATITVSPPIPTVTKTVKITYAACTPLGASLCTENGEKKKIILFTVDFE